MPSKFNIEYFEPKHLKKADKALERHLEEVQIKLHANESYQKTFASKNTLWLKVKKLFS